MGSAKNTFLSRIYLLFFLVCASSYTIINYTPQRSIEEAIILADKISSKKTTHSDGICHTPSTHGIDDRVRHINHMKHSHLRHIHPMRHSHHHGRNLDDLVDPSTIIPECGKTLCDVPSVQQSYVENKDQRGSKTLKYCIINLAYDDQTIPTISQEDYEFQDNFLNQQFNGTGIDWELHIVNIHQTSLRKLQVIYGCDKDMIGNGKCDEACDEVKTGQDGGDCNSEKSTEGCSLKRGNNKCDGSCNNVYNDYDGGDCCDPEISERTHETCFDPMSPNRAYLSVDEYKILLNLDNLDCLNVYFAFWTSLNLMGVATFPWETDVYSNLGGTIMNPNTYGKNPNPDGESPEVGAKALIHEFGHNLGLWHTHRGVTEVRDCEDPCFENEKSSELGDLCSDTGPSPLNFRCSISSEEKCGVSSWPNTPIHNYMSYSLKSCSSGFSEQQIARMHCYVDLKYERWLANPQPPSILIYKPAITHLSGSSVTLEWQPPISFNAGLSDVDVQCNQCIGSPPVLTQYASNIEEASREEEVSGDVTNVLGMPDTTCTEFAGTTSYMPKGNSITHISFEQADWPDKLTIVFNYGVGGSSSYDMTVEAKNKQSNWIVIKTGLRVTRCYQEISLINHPEKISDIRLTSTSTLIRIDAFILKSRPGTSNCNGCVNPQYVLTRNPPFPSSVVLDETRYIDTIEVDKTYTWTISTRGRYGDSGSSPPLTFSLSGSYCGDGIVDDDEECDDNNFQSGDGCSRDCIVEEDFHCRVKDGAYTCYRHCGDGICEAFENNPCCHQDCDPCTPEDSLDQWGSTVLLVTSSHVDQAYHPNNTQGRADFQDYRKCTRPSYSSRKTWYPGTGSSNAIAWVQVPIDSPVLATDVTIYVNMISTAEFAVALMDTNGELHYIQEKERLSCGDGPFTFNVAYDLTNLFYTSHVRVFGYGTSGFVDAIRVRSLKDLEPVTCAEGTVSRAGECVPKLICGPKTELVNGACISKVKCGDRTELVNGKCVPKKGLTCGNGTREENRVCVSTKCGTTTHEKDGFCVPKSDNPVKCGPSTRVIDGRCVGLTCGDDTHEDGGRCIPNGESVRCGTGVKKENGFCVGSITCDVTTIEIDGVCHPLVCGNTTREENGVCKGTVSCGQGTHRQDGYCVRTKICPED